MVFQNYQLLFNTHGRLIAYHIFDVSFSHFLSRVTFKENLIWIRQHMHVLQILQTLQE